MVAVNWALVTSLLRSHYNVRALDRGYPMVPVDLRNANVPCRYFRNFSVDFKIA